MFKIIRALALFLFLSVGLIRSAAAETFLPPEQAFAFSAVMRDAGTVQVTFDVASNYYMYRDEFKFEVVSPNATVVQNGAVKLPIAQNKFDENFNKEVAIYHGRVTINVPVSGTGLFKLVATSRGCADGGLCYPPRRTQAVLTAQGGAASRDAPKLNVDAAAPSRPNATTTLSNDVKQAAASKKDALGAAAAPLPADVSKSIDPARPSLSTDAPLPSNAASSPVDVVQVADTTNTANAQIQTLDNSSYARGLFDSHNFPVALLLLFGLGVLLSLTPCMLPMVPILSSILAGQQVVSRRRGFLLALAYVTGMAVVYALIGVFAAKTGASLHRYLQNPWVLGALAGLLLLLALSLFDVFQLQLPVRWQAWLNSKTQGKNGYWGVAVMGAVSALIASPCVTAPLVGVITYIAQTGNVALGGLALFVLAYGMGMPLLLLGAGLGQLLPKNGAWMVRIKQLIGLIMVAAALWVAQPLWGKYWQQAWGDRAAAVVFQPVKSMAALNEVIASSDQPVFLDVYADWCRSCIEMEKKTFPDPRVQARMAKMTRVRIDMTAYTDDDAAVLAHFNLYGPPAMMVLEPLTGKEKMRVIGFESADEFVRSLDGQR